MKEIILSGKELSLAVEGRSTNLRIWLSKGVIYMRLDKYKNYSVPLNSKNITYLEKKNDVVNELAYLFGFNSATIEDIDIIINIVKNMKIRTCKNW